MESVFQRRQLRTGNKGIYNMFNSRCAMGATTLHRRDILVNRGRGRPHKERKGFEGEFEKGVEEHDWSHD